MWWICVAAASALVALGLVWFFIFRAAMRERNDHGEFSYRDVSGQ